MNGSASGIRSWKNTSILDTPHRETVRPIIVVRGIHSPRIEVQIVGVRPVRTGRPVVAVRTLIVEIAIGTIPVTG